MEKLFEDSTLIKLKDQIVTKIISINAIKAVQTKFGKSFLCYNLKHNTSFFSNSQLKGYLNKIVPNLQCSNGIYTKDEALNDIVKFSIESIGDNNQVKLNFIRNKVNATLSTKPIPLSDSDKEPTVYHKMAKEINIDDSQEQ